MPAEVIWQRDGRAGCKFVQPVPKGVVSAALLLSEPLAQTEFVPRYDLETSVEKEEGAGVQMVLAACGIMLIIALLILSMALWNDLNIPTQ